jgi:hypothetical protein
MGDTKKDLVEDLDKKPRSLQRDMIRMRAKAGDYHDFDSKLAAPKMQLATDLRAAGFRDLADKAISGAYDDESPTLEQEEELRREFGAEAYDQLMSKKERGES